jgi:hypothetical protein
MLSGQNLWRPGTKKELIHSLGSIYRGEEEKLRKMPKKQLMAIFYYLRRRYGYFS